MSIDRQHAEVSWEHVAPRRPSSRRRFLITGLGGLFGSIALSRRSSAQQVSAAQPPGVVTLRGRLSLVTSGGTNVLVLSTRDGLVLVDSGAPALSEALVASLAQMAPGGRVVTVFNTHWHAENTGANELLAHSRPTIVAHENTRLWMSTATWIPAEDRYRSPRPRAAHPTQTFYAERSTTVEGGGRVDYGYLIDAHTSGDIYVFFRDANVLAVGDVVSPARDPELDSFTGAWLGGRVDALDRLLALCDAETRIVPGYGPVMNRTDLQSERDMMMTLYDRAVDRVRQGESVDEMLAAGIMDGLPRTWNNPRKFLADVHKGLWAHHNKLAPNVV